MNPLVSFVMAGRNDDYGGNFLNRISTCIRVLDAWCTKHGLAAEVVVVDYNPPVGAPHLRDALSELVPAVSIPVRFIIVPNEFHLQFEGSNKNPLFEFIAKNIGARRALGEYVVAMNPDIVLSEALIRALAKQPLDPKNYYRANRHDIRPKFIDPSLSPEQVEAFCARNTTKVLHAGRTKYVSYRAWLHRFVHGRTLRSFLFLPLLNGLHSYKDEEFLHENAAGDFLMAHKEAWNASGGYDEIPLGSGTLDSYLLYVMYCLGYGESIFSEPIYHVEHEYGKGGRPLASFQKFRTDVDVMLETHVLYKTPNPEWGFPKETFPEESFR